MSVVDGNVNRRVSKRGKRHMPVVTRRPTVPRWQSICTSWSISSRTPVTTRKRATTYENPPNSFWS